MTPFRPRSGAMHFTYGKFVSKNASTLEETTLNTREVWSFYLLSLSHISIISAWPSYTFPHFAHSRFGISNWADVNNNIIFSPTEAKRGIVTLRVFQNTLTANFRVLITQKLAGSRLAESVNSVSRSGAKNLAS